MLPKKDESRYRTALNRLFKAIPLKRFGGIALAIFATISASSAANLSNPQVDAYNVRIGTETFAPMYSFTANTHLVETAEAMTNMGSDIIKLYLGSDTVGQEGVTNGSGVTNLVTEVRDDPGYHQVFDMPFRHFVCWAYPLENSDEWWGSGYNATGGARDYQEMYDLTRYFLTNYNNSGKTFYLGHWEGDGYLEVNGWTTNPSMTTVQGMIGWLNNRQKAVDDAKAATIYSNVWVYNYAECNRVRDAMLNNSNNNVRVINYVVPFVTNLDYLSYSSYDSQNLSASDLYTTLNYMQSMLPTNKASVVPGERMWIGEYGWGTESTAAQEPLMRSYMQRLINWNNNGECLPFILYWEMYSNLNPGSGTNFCLINYLDQKVPGWYLHNYFINDAKMLVAQFDETNGRLPTDTEFTSMVSPLLNAPLSAPVPLTVGNAGAMLITNTTASVSGTLAQGIYGDSEAVMWVYYGTQDGGTTFTAWQHAQLVGVNTHFNPATFTATLSGLAPQTNYFYRFYAQNNTSSNWAPTSSQFSTVTANPAAYGSRLEIFFSGYNRGETLANFPVLVNLSTNLPGFSYQQFASPSGGDLRFTDESGVSMIPFEIDQWNTNGTSSVWVNVPSISSPNDFIWAYWGNPTATNLPASSTNGAAWPGYEVVYHLEQTSFPYLDSTHNYPAMNGVAPAPVAGIVGNGQSFNGSSDYLDAGIVNLGNLFTESAWVNLSSSESNIQGIWANGPGGFSTSEAVLFVNDFNTTDGALLFGVDDEQPETATGLVTSGHWHLLTSAVNRTAGTIQFYIDGNPEPLSPSGDSGVTDDFPTDVDMNLGRFTSDTANPNGSFHFNGIMDEARINGSIEDSNWVWASWATVASNSSFENYSVVTRTLPQLTIGTGGNGNGGSISLGWPSSGVGYELYTTTNLTPPVSWQPLATQPVFTNNQWQINLPSNSNVRFYRIESQ